MQALGETGLVEETPLSEANLRSSSDTRRLKRIAEEVEAGTFAHGITDRTQSLLKDSTFGRHYQPFLDAFKTRKLGSQAAYMLLHAQETGGPAEAIRSAINAANDGRFDVRARDRLAFALSGDKDLAGKFSPEFIEANAKDLGRFTGITGQADDKIKKAQEVFKDQIAAAVYAQGLERRQRGDYLSTAVDESGMQDYVKRSAAWDVERAKSGKGGMGVPALSDILSRFRGAAEAMKATKPVDGQLPPAPDTSEMSYDLWRRIKGGDKAARQALDRAGVAAPGIQAEVATYSLLSSQLGKKAKYSDVIQKMFRGASNPEDIKALDALKKDWADKTRGADNDKAFSLAIGKSTSAMRALGGAGSVTSGIEVARALKEFVTQVSALATTVSGGTTAK